MQQTNTLKPKTTKKCNIMCGRVKPLSAFRPREKSRGGHRNQCKSCCKIQADNLTMLRKSNGQCPRCGKKAVVNRTLCKDCAEQRAKRRLEQHAKGLCWCGRPLLEGRKYCQACATYRLKLVNTYREQGRCQCGKPNLKGKNYCAGCVAARNKRTQLHRSQNLCWCGRPSAPHQIACVGCSASNKRYQSAHKAEHNAYRKERSKTDVVYRLSEYLRTRTRNALKGNHRQGSAIRDLGCSIEDLKKHLEQQFEPGMTWDNHGTGPGDWHIDHIIPLITVDLSDRTQSLKVAHYTNLRPLWRHDNLGRKAKSHPLHHTREKGTTPWPQNASSAKPPKAPSPSRSTTRATSLGTSVTTVSVARWDSSCYSNSSTESSFPCRRCR